MTPALEGLTPTAAVVLGEAVNLVLATRYRFADGAPLHERCAAKGVSAEALGAGVAELHAVGYVDVAPLLRGRVDYVILSWEGVTAWLTATRPDLAAIRRRVIGHVLAAPERGIAVGELAEALQLEPLTIEALLTPYDRRDDLKIVRYSHVTMVTDVSRSLRQAVE